MSSSAEIVPTGYAVAGDAQIAPPSDRKLEMGAVPIASTGELSAQPSWWKRLAESLRGGTMVRKGLVSLVDQGVVSAVNFFTMVLIQHAVQRQFDRTVAYHELGLYTLAFSIVQLASAAQGALITTPYAVFGNRLQGAQRALYAGSVVIHQWLFSALGTLVLAAAGMVIAFGWGSAGFAPVSGILAVVLPLLLVREFVRRIAFAHLQVVQVLLLDVAVAVLQLGGLAALALSGRLTAVSAYGAVGLACALAGGSAFFLMRKQFAFCRPSIARDLRLNWSFGKWAFAGQVVYLIMAYGMSWLLAFLASTDATGSYAACMSLVMIANPLLLGLNNFFSPQAIHVFQAEGLKALRQLLLRMAFVLTGVVSLLCVTLIVISDKLLTMFYGAPLPGQVQVVSILAISMLMYGLSMTAENGLIALNRPRVVFWGNVAGLVITITAGVTLIALNGIVGAALAALAGTTAATAVKVVWIAAAFRRDGRGSG
jgi:O-antigen/teichoic acid export membrane protein